MENLKIIPSQARYLAKPQAYPDPTTALFTIEGHISFDITQESGISLSSFQLNFIGNSEQRYLVTTSPGSGTQLHTDLQLGSKVFFEEECELIFMFLGGKVPPQKELQKGPHLFAFLVRVPHELPSTTDNCLQSISYELQLSCEESPSKSWFKSSRSWKQRKDVIIHVHPSKDTMTSTNLLDLRLLPLIPLPDGLQVLASGQVPNARLGGCFDLSIKFTLDPGQVLKDERVPTSIRVGSLKVILVQTASINSSHGKIRTLDQQKVLLSERSEKDASIDLIFSDDSEPASHPASTDQPSTPAAFLEPRDSGFNSASNRNSSDVLFDSEVFCQDSNSPIDSSTKPHDSRKIDADFIIKRQKSYLLKRNVDFPEGEGDLIQPSTPPKTRTPVSFGHSFQVELEVQLLNGDQVITEEKVKVGNEFMLARKSFSTGEMTLPSYDALKDVEVP